MNGKIEIEDQSDEDVDAVCLASKAGVDLTEHQRSTVLDWIFDGGCAHIWAYPGIVR